LAYKNAGNYLKAIQNLDQSRWIAQGNGLENQVALVENNLANIYLLRGDTSTAIDRFRAVLEIKGSEAEFLTLATYGEILYRKSDYELAKTYLTQSIEKFENPRWTNDYLRTLGILTEIYMKEGRNDLVAHYIGQITEVKDEMSNQATHININKELQADMISTILKDRSQIEASNNDWMAGWIIQALMWLVVIWAFLSLMKGRGRVTWEYVNRELKQIAGMF
jgi:tetratricopeptide (TPR) repeat protein